MYGLKIRVADGHLRILRVVAATSQTRGGEGIRVHVEKSQGNCCIEADAIASTRMAPVSHAHLRFTVIYSQNI